MINIDQSWFASHVCESVGACNSQYTSRKMAAHLRWPSVRWHRAAYFLKCSFDLHKLIKMLVIWRQGYKKLLISTEPLRIRSWPVSPSDPDTSVPPVASWSATWTSSADSKRPFNGCRRAKVWSGAVLILIIIDPRFWPISIASLDIIGYLDDLRCTCDACHVPWLGWSSRNSSEQRRWRLSVSNWSAGNSVPLMDER